MLQRLERSELFLDDSTFKVMPWLFSAIYNTCKGLYFRKHTPRHAHKHLRLGAKSQFHYNSDKKAVISAFRVEFSNSMLSGCFFPVSPFINRKAQLLDLKQEFKNEPNFNILAKGIAALYFVPLQDTARVFDELCGHFPHDDK